MDFTGAWPEPTADELSTLTIHITSWGSRTRLQQSICLAVLRGHRGVGEIARYLGVGRTDVESEVADLIGEGLLWDGTKLILH
jgi:hypothetical protein